MTKAAFSQLVDLEKIRELLNSHYRITGILSAILDPDDNILVAVGWQDICEHFHRKNQLMSARCRESDAFIKSRLGDISGGYLDYRCSNGLHDVALPIIIDGEHLATFFTGQFFYDDDRPDKEFFRSQAREFGFDEAEYMDALDRVKVFSREQVRSLMDFYGCLVRMITEMGLRNLELTREIAVRTAAEKELKAAEAEVLKLNAELEERVGERTAQLVGANERLRLEVVTRERMFKELQLTQFCVDKASIGIFRISENGKIIYANALACRNLGYSAEELDALTLFDIDPTFDIQRFNEHRNLLHDAGSRTFETLHRRKDGSTYPVEISVNYLQYGGKGFTVSFARDITERKRAEEELKRSKENLEELNRTLHQRVKKEVARSREKDVILIQQNRQAALGETMEHIIHQWKQPLNTIGLLVQIIQSRHSSGKLTKEFFRESVDKTMDQLEHMSETAELYRDYFKPEKERKEFSIIGALDEAASFLETVFRHQKIMVDIDADTELTGFGFKNEFVQVLLIIMNNACDAFLERKTEGARLTARAFREGRKAVITLSDNAGGIPEKVIGKVFDLYFTTKEKKGGTGIGLYMARNIIEKRMKGSLSVANAEGGARFRIEISSPKRVNVK